MAQRTSLVEEKPVSKISPKNTLNNLTGREWIHETCSIYYQKGLGRNHIEAKYEMMHPAPFSYRDISRMIGFFTRKNDKVLDPFCGVASTLKACSILQRKGIGIELNKKWVKVAKLRLKNEVNNDKNQKIITGDSRIILKTIPDNTIHYVVTSPPYWNILNKKININKQKERINLGLDTNYSNSNKDLGNIENYDEFLNELKICFTECYRILHTKKYMTIIVSDFRIKSTLIPFHSDIIDMCNKIGFTLQGIGILVQSHKKLYPYGYPYAYVPNIHHQYFITVKKI